jgi:hypothetical protein
MAAELSQKSEALTTLPSLVVDDVDIDATLFIEDLYLTHTHNDDDDGNDGKDLGLPLPLIATCLGINFTEANVTNATNLTNATNATTISSSSPRAKDFRSKQACAEKHSKLNNCDSTAVMNKMKHPTMIVDKSVETAAHNAFVEWKKVNFRAAATPNRGKKKKMSDLETENERLIAELAVAHKTIDELRLKLAKTDSNSGTSTCSEVFLPTEERNNNNNHHNMPRSDQPLVDLWDDDVDVMKYGSLESTTCNLEK